MTSVPQSEPVTAVELRRVLETSLDLHFERHRAITELDRRPAPYYSSFRLEELDVRLDDGSELALMFKELGSGALLDEAREAKPLFLQNPVREIVAYRDILAAQSLGTPMCYGSVVSPEREQYWLFLERIAGARLSEIGDLSSWKAAARWLAALHARFAGERARLKRHESLLTYDRSIFAQWMPRALEVAARAGNAERRTKLEWLAQRYDRVVVHLARLPLTLIHGEFYASNVLIQEQGSHDTRVCPVDWEMAGIGPGEIDVAALISGGWGEAERRELAAEYHASALRFGRSLSTLDEFLVTLDYCCLHLAVQWLGWSATWSPPAEQAQDWLRVGIDAAKRLAL